MNDSTKRWLISTLLTFVSGAALVIVPQIDSLTKGDLQGAALIGLASAVVRGGLKAVLESLVRYSIKK